MKEEKIIISKERQDLQGVISDLLEFASIADEKAMDDLLKEVNNQLEHALQGACHSGE